MIWQFFFFLHFSDKYLLVEAKNHGLRRLIRNKNTSFNEQIRSVWFETHNKSLARSVWIVSRCLNPSFISVSDSFLHTEFKDQNLDDPTRVSGPDPYQQHKSVFLGPFSNVWFSWAHTILISVRFDFKVLYDE